MTFRTITAKYPGTCKRCQSAIFVGDRIRYAGPGRTWHLAADCHGAPESTIAPVVNHADDTEADSGGHPVRHPARRSSYTRFSSGAEVFTNARGRCEDAPCCGCCS